jgi:hypothetical protein
MPSSYTTSLRLTLPATGELAGQWGNTVNTGITELLDAAVAGTTTISTWGGAGVAYTLSNNSGTADEARRMFIVATGTPGEAKNVICPAVSKFYVFRNDTTGGFALTLKTSGGTGIAVPAGQYKVLYCNGTNVVEAFNSLASLTLGTALAASSGGTGQSTYTVGDLVYATGTTALSKLGIGTNGQILTSTGTAPQWSTLSGVAVTTFSAGTTGFTPSTATAGAVTLAGTLATTNGGTGLTSFTSGGVVYASSSSALTTGSALTFDGTSLGLNASPNLILSSSSVERGRIVTGTGAVELMAGSTTIPTISMASSVATFTNNPVLSGGTANGVLYLNGSKVATSGSALTFDGTNLGVGTANPSTLGKLATVATAGATALYAGSAGQGVYISNSTGTEVVYNASGNSAGVHVWQTGNSEQMRLTSTGLGIGTTPGAKLDVFGSGNIVRYGDGTNTFNVRFKGPNNWDQQLDTAADKFSIRRNSVDFAVIDSAGNLGIGTSSPQQKLHVVSTSSGAATYPLMIENGASATGTESRIFFVQGGNTTRGAYIGGRNEDASGAPTSMVFGVSSAFAAPTERMRLDSSGNLGLGVTPSANDYTGAAQFKWIGHSVTPRAVDNLAVTMNAYHSGGGWKYGNTGVASNYIQSAGQHAWLTAPSGTAGNAISFTQAMTLDASGNLLVGGTSVYAATITSYATATRSGGLGIRNSAGTAAGAITTYAAGSGSGSTDIVVESAGFLAFNAGGTTERARITSGGYFKASNAGTYLGSTGAYHELRSNADGNTAVISSTNTGSNVVGAYVELPGAVSTLARHFVGNLAGVGVQFEVSADGDVTNTNGTYGTISDQRIKQDIVDASSQWADIKAIRFRKYRLKQQVARDANAPYLLGVVAQEIEQTSPGLVEDGEVKSVKSSVLLMKAAVALQEAMARIEQLEARVAALESN